MKAPILTALLLLLIFDSCKDDNTLKIKFQLNKATVERLKGKYVYLKNVNTKTIIDSLIIDGEDNQFTIPINTYKVSETYSILMNDTGYINGVEINYKKPLGYLGSGISSNFSKSYLYNNSHSSSVNLSIFTFLNFL